mmetsp:Transcript_84538/g.217783  ORF Transcript_84538/g.217783 Transcript_84538/m.217783 type:complete len:224 (-) Transcript_84538:344-1015(-)
MWIVSLVSATTILHLRSGAGMACTASSARMTAGCGAFPGLRSPGFFEVMVAGFELPRGCSLASRPSPRGGGRPGAPRARMCRWSSRCARRRLFEYTWCSSLPQQECTLHGHCSSAWAIEAIASGTASEGSSAGACSSGSSSTGAASSQAGLATAGTLSSSSSAASIQPGCAAPSSTAWSSGSLVIGSAASWMTALDSRALCWARLRRCVLLRRCLSSRDDNSC